ncbi:hypothetical protein L1887_29015 [Cichorium endivia]|nr:hypothetical protein L1887_29015 [Cichorium endivia]
MLNCDSYLLQPNHLHNLDAASSLEPSQSFTTAITLTIASVALYSVLPSTVFREYTTSSSRSKTINWIENFGVLFTRQADSLKKMQGGRGRSDPFFGFGDPFSGFGRRDPFDDPFFTQPFGGMLQPSPFGHSGSPFMGAPPFSSSLFGPNGSPFMDAHAPTIYNHMQSIPNSSRRPIIQELNPNDEEEAGNSMEENQLGVMHDTYTHQQPHGFTFQSSTVTYGGSNGAYYTSSTTRRAGSDGLRFEEHKEADSVSGKAAHRISRGIYNKGHTVSRHLKSDGHVDTMQTLHNINEDELDEFEEAWKGKAKKHLPGWIGGHNVGEGRRGGLSLPSTENKKHGGGRRR